MTVTDLIAYLERLPRDAVIGVVYRRFSEYAVLEEQDLRFIPAEGLEERWPVRRDVRHVLRHGKIMEYDPATWDPAEAPHFVAVLAFPGN